MAKYGRGRLGGSLKGVDKLIKQLDALLANPATQLTDRAVRSILDNSALSVSPQCLIKTLELFQKRRVLDKVLSESRALFNLIELVIQKSDDWYVLKVLVQLGLAKPVWSEMHAASVDSLISCLLERIPKLKGESLAQALCFLRKVGVVWEELNDHLTDCLCRSILNIKTLDNKALSFFLSNLDKIGATWDDCSCLQQAAVEKAVDAALPSLTLQELAVISLAMARLYCSSDVMARIQQEGMKQSEQFELSQRQQFDHAQHYMLVYGLVPEDTISILGYDEALSASFAQEPQTTVSDFQMEVFTMLQKLYPDLKFELEMMIGPYSVDIAGEGFVVEVNGPSHFLMGYKRKPSDLKRRAFIEQYDYVVINVDYQDWPEEYGAQSDKKERLLKQAFTGLSYSDLAYDDEVDADAASQVPTSILTSYEQTGIRKVLAREATGPVASQGMNVSRL